MDHREEVLGKFVVTSGDAPEVLELAEEPLNEITLAIEPLAEAWFPFAIGFGGMFGTAPWASMRSRMPSAS